MTKKSWNQYSQVAPAIERTGADGFVYDSKTEYQRYCYLELRQRAGEIINLERQPKFPLAHRCDNCEHEINIVRKLRGGNDGTAVYTADFQYDEVLGKDKFNRVIEDVKGYRDEGSKFRIRVFEAIYGLKVTLIQKKNKRWVVMK